MAQNWNNLLTYIKRKLGVPINLFELTDDDIYDTIKEDVLPAMSQYIGKPFWVKIGREHLETTDNPNRPEIYVIPVPENIILIDVQHVYYHRDNMGTLGIYQNMLAVLDPRDTVMTNEFLDMLSSLEAVQAFHFIPPNKIYFEKPLFGSGVILECKAQHTDLESIPSDIYNEILKPWSLAEILENVAAIRKKFRSVSSPFGQIEMNPEELEATAQNLRQTIQDKLDNMPPDHLVHIF